MSHKNSSLAALEAALALQVFGPDPDDMVGCVEFVNVDDEIWIKLRDYRSGRDLWVSTYGFRRDGTCTARAVDADTLKETDLDSWR